MKKWLLVAAASAALLTGCGKKDNAEKADEAIEAVQADIGKISDIQLRKGNAAKAGEALTALSLADSGAGRVAFADATIDGATATFANVVISPEPDEDGSSEAIKAGSLVFQGLDMTDAGATFSRMTLSDITITPDDPEKAAKADVSLAQIELTNPSPATAAWVSSLLGKGEPAPFPSVGELAFDAFTMSNFAVDIHDEEDPGTVAIEGIRIQGVGDDKMELASISGIIVDVNDKDDGPIKFGIDNMSLFGADYSVVKDIQALGPDAGEDAITKTFMQSMYADPTNPPLDGVVMQGLTFDGQGIKFDMPLYDARVQRDRQDRMVGQVLKPVRMTLSADAEGGEGGAALAGMLGQLGYEKIEMLMESSSKYDPDKDIYSYETKDSYFELVDGIKMSFGGKIEGYADYSRSLGMMFSEMDPKKGGAPDPDMMMDALSKMAVHGFEIKLEDNSLIDRAFNLAAAQSGEDPQQMRNQVVMMMGMAPMMAAQSGVDAALVQEAAGAVTSFISDGGTLTIKLDPKQPFRLSDFEDPSQITKESLGFSATQK